MGVRSSLMKHVEGVAAHLDLEKPRLVVHEEAHWAIKFHERLGYRMVDHIQRAAWRDVVMEKRLKC